MPVETAIDRSYLLSDFGVSANYTPVGGASTTVTVIFDNEPRNRELLKQIEKQIEKGNKVALWPDSMKHKDINDMVMAGYTKKQIQEIIDDNTFSGVSAQLRFSEWKKINEGNMGNTIRQRKTTLEL